MRWRTLRSFSDAVPVIGRNRLIFGTTYAFTSMVMHFSSTYCLTAFMWYSSLVHDCATLSKWGRNVRLLSKYKPRLRAQVLIPTSSPQILRAELIDLCIVRALPYLLTTVFELLILWTVDTSSTACVATAQEHPCSIMPFPCSYVSLPPPSEDIDRKWVEIMLRLCSRNAPAVEIMILANSNSTVRRRVLEATYIQNIQPSINKRDEMVQALRYLD